MSEIKVMVLCEVINVVMSEEMCKDEKVFLMGEDVGVYGGDFGIFVGMLEEFGVKCVCDILILEVVIVGLVIGVV